MINLPPHLAKLSGTLNPTPMMNYTTKLNSENNTISGSIISKGM